MKSDSLFLKEVELNHPMVLSNSKIFFSTNLMFSMGDTFIKHQFINLFIMTSSLVCKTVLVNNKFN